MKISILSNRQRPRPDSPCVNLTLEAYDALMALANQHNISMRKLASEIIVEACKNIEVVKTDG